MTSVYLILAHKYPTFLKRIIESLDYERNYFIIHIDAKVTLQSFHNVFEPKFKDHIFFTPDRYNIVWGHFSIIEATVSMIRFCYNQGIEADYFHLISGQDYPVKSNKEITDFLSHNNGKSFIHFFKLPARQWAAHEGGLLRFRYKWYLNEEHSLSYNNIDFKKENDFINTLPEGIIPYGGSAWWSLHKSCIQYIYENCKNGNQIYSYYRYAFLPDEMFFQTLLLNSRHKDFVVNDNLRYIQWQEGKANPLTLSMKNKNVVLDTDSYFARKFDPLIDSDILDLIDKKRNESKRNKINNHYNHFKSILGKYCILSAVGKNSLHRKWVNDHTKEDLHLIVYDDSYEKYKKDSPNIIKSTGQKFKLIYEYLSTNKGTLEKYDYFYMPDDDIDIDSNNILKLIWYMKEYELDIAQPAIANSYFTYKHTIKHPNSIIRFTNFIEIMQPCFSKDALTKVLFTFNENENGWGIDFHWGLIIDYRKYNMAVIDDIHSVHTKPVQFFNEEAGKELTCYLKKYDLKTEIITI